MSDDAKTAETASAPRAKRGIPRTALPTAETYARGVWEAARLGSAPAVSVARAISGKDDAVASGGRWRAKVAALRVFNLIEKSETQMRLTDIGFALVNTVDADKQREGRRLAVLAVESYAAILQQNDGHPLPPTSTVAGRFEFEYALGSEEARAAADVFIQSVKHAGLVDSGGIVRLSGAAVEEGAAQTDEQPMEDEADQAPPIVPDPVTAASKDNETPQPPASAENSPIPQTPGIVSIDVTINMSKWPVDDILKVLDVFGYSRAKTHDE